MNMRQVTIALLLLSSLMHPAVAGTTTTLPGQASASGQCHALMTEKECAEFLATLASLPPGLERERFLRAHLETKLERERLCNKKALQQPVVYYPRVYQAMLRY